ncbi:MAG: hypothetical protein RIB93_06675 [Coleofasciculus sp. D1-CHI-01]|uniref:hypothetical protein n=1 Tax=Coleofasciculus sp. D1-CHI-01 TaxID=3068482 RepID=UPI0032FB1034
MKFQREVEASVHVPPVATQKSSTVGALSQSYWNLARNTSLATAVIAPSTPRNFSRAASRQQL